MTEKPMSDGLERVLELADAHALAILAAVEAHEAGDFEREEALRRASAEISEKLNAQIKSYSEKQGA